jgi:GT2 family glycosyltransferase
VSVSVLIITRDRCTELLRTLANLTAAGEADEILVVDHVSADGTPDRVRERFPGVRVLEPGRDLGAAGRTLAALAATGRYVAFCDDDSWWAPGALTRAAELLDRHPSVGLVAGRVLLGDDGRLEPTCAAMAASPLPAAHGLPGPRVLGFVACGAVVRRDAFLVAGGFEPHCGVGGEERLLAAALADRGWDLVYVAELVAYHHPSPVRNVVRRRAIELRNDLWFAWLRRPPRRVVAETGRAIARAAREAPARTALRDAVAGLPWVLARRRPVHMGVERDLRLLDRTA